MHKLRYLVVVSALTGLSACSQIAGPTDSHLDCAALISAANQLSAKGELETSAAFDSKALASGMTHLNTYAIPNNIVEADAFKQLNARSAEIMEETTPSNILARAEACIRKTPGR